MPARATRSTLAALARRARARIGGHRAELHVDRLPAEQVVRLAFELLLRREPDSAALDHYRERMERGELTRVGLVDVLLSSTEYRHSVSFDDLLASMHVSRSHFVRGLPPARRILDLGGTDQADDRGALVSLGYPYRFDRLVVVDLPPDERHALYRRSTPGRLQCELGPIEYAYHSMADLSPYEEESFDLVYSGQSIEHVTEPEARAVLAGALRVLVPGGWLCLDTPNGPLWRLHSPELVNPDHKVEYGHDQLRAMILAAGFEIVEAKGLNYAGPAAEEGRFDPLVAARNVGVFARPEACLHLAYVCRKPST